MRKSGFMVALLAAVIAGCGGGSEDDAFQPGQTPGTPTTPAVASVTVVTDTPTIPSSGLAPANISVFVRNASNQFMQGVPVTISSSSGGLAITSGVTNANGVATATLTPAGDRTSRTITVTAVAGGISSLVTVKVTGTSIDIQGPDALITGTAGPYTIIVVDSANNPVAGQAVTIASQPSSTLSASTGTTDTNGRVTFNMTPTGSAAVTLTVTAAGETKTKTVAVSADNFAFQTPAEGAQFGIGGAGASVSVRWLSGGSPVANGQTVNFATTRGTLSSITTTAGGVATATVTSTTAGEALVTATNASGGSTQRRIIFVASTAAVVDLQSNPFAVAINQSSTLTATVRDASNNLVANKAVVFSLNDPTGGSLSVGTAVTDSQGRARTVYTASSTTSATNGVRVTVTVQDTPSVTDYVDLTVAGAPLFLSFGTGNTIEQINNDTQYRLNYTVQVTDSTGAGVSGVTVTVSALSWDYVKGFREVLTGATNWSTHINAVCTNEDRRSGNPAYDFNGILDPGENENGLNNDGNLSMESGNIVTISPGTGTTDASGFLPFTVTYPQDHADYLSIALRGRTAVQGTEFSRTTLPFSLPGAAPDFANPTINPPGLTSPFGIAATCSTFN
ncbi:MAG: Ig-like domain-containing protein [Pseudomonadota bacterium]